MKIRTFLKNVGSAILNRNKVALAETEYAKRGSFFDSVNAFSDELGEIDPGFPVVFIDIFSKLAVINPDVSQAVQKIISLGNVGHSLEIEGRQRAAGAALEELNELARSAFPSNAGADGFINQQFRQIAITGALCQETVPSLGFEEVEQVYQVRTSSIRFRLENNRFVPLQQVGIRKIRLNPETFSYIPLFTDEDSPYGIPSFMASLRMLLRQEKQWENIDDFMNLWGILGLTWLKVDAKRRFDRTPHEQAEDIDKELKKYYNLFLKHMKKGIAVTGTNVDIDHTNVSKNAGQIEKLIEATEQQIASGLDIDPAMLGRTYSTTETYATVCYQTLLGKIDNIRRIIKRANEHTYNLHLTLRRIPAVCSMKFHDSPSLKLKDEIETEEIKQRMVFERLDKGIIDEDTAARELGYEEAYRKEEDSTGEKLSRVEFRFDKDSNKYVFIRPVVTVQLAKKKSDYELVTELEEGYSSGFFEIYRRKYGEFLSGLEAHVEKEKIADAIMDSMKLKMGKELPEEAKDAIQKWTEKGYKSGVGVDWKGEKKEWAVTDRNALDFLKRHDQHFFGKQFQHYSADMRAIVEDELSGIRGSKSEAVRKLKDKLGDAFEHPKVIDHYDLVIKNAVNKSRNYGRIFRYERLGIADVEVIAILDFKTSIICRGMNGRRISVRYLADHVREVLKTPMDELTERFAWPSQSEAKDWTGLSTSEILGKINVPLPPYHGRCRTTTGISKGIKIRKAGGEYLSGDIAPRVGKESKNKRERRKHMEKLLTIERLSKIRQQSETAWWDEPGETERIDRHKSIHAKEFASFDESYDEISKKILKSFDRVYTFIEGKRIKWGFYSDKYGALVLVDETNGQLLTMYKIDDIDEHLKTRKADFYLEIL